ncbi:hypothetical protein [Shewanella sp. SNU WT4]|uniref:hypothetical protein n=1 Tax=Shewanella sp. SNU WT4 TaxID=2590015 RepID=UPI00143D8CE0|nr:hypothetical protein [Shewanella sp. SNU WT4]
MWASWPIALVLITIIDVALLAATTELSPWQNVDGGSHSLTILCLLISLTV